MDPPNYHPPPPNKDKAKSKTNKSSEKKSKSPSKAKQNKETQVCSVFLYVTMLEWLGEVERTAIKAVGLDGLLHFCRVKIRRNLCRWIAEKYRPDLDAFVIGGDPVQLKKEDFDHIFGLPARRRILGQSPRQEVLEMLHQMMNKKPKRIHFTELQDTIKKGIKQPSDELPFLQAFIMFTIGCILCPSTQRSVSVEYLPYLVSKEAIIELDLAKLSVDHLLNSINQYNAALKDPERGLQKTTNLEGNLPLLQVWYWEKFRVDKYDASIDYKGREAPLLQYWDEEKATKVCAVLNVHGREAGELVHDLKEDWEPPMPSSPMPLFDELPPTDSKLVIKLFESFLKMRSDMMFDNLLTRKEVGKVEDYVFRFGQKLDGTCEKVDNLMQIYENGPATYDYEYKEYKDFSKERTSPVPVRDLNQQFESVVTNNKQNKRPSDNVNTSPTKKVKLQDDTGAKKRELRKRTSTNKNTDFLYFSDSKSTRKPKITPKAMSTKGTDSTPDEDMQGEVIDYINASPPRKILVKIDDLDLHQDELTCLTSPQIYTSNKGWLNSTLLDTVVTWMRHMRPDPDLRAGGTVYMERPSRADLLVTTGSVASYNMGVRMKKDGTEMGKMYISHDMTGLIVNHDNKHWYVVYVNPGERKIQVLDSMRKETRNFKKFHPELEHLLKGMEAHLDVTSAYLDATSPPDCKKSDSWRDYAVNSWPVQVMKNVPQQKDGMSCGLYALKNLEKWIGDQLSEKFTQADVDKFRKQLPALIVKSPLNLAP